MESREGGDRGSRGEVGRKQVRGIGAEESVAAAAGGSGTGQRGGVAAARGARGDAG